MHVGGSAVGALEAPLLTHPALCPLPSALTGSSKWGLQSSCRKSSAVFLGANRRSCSLPRCPKCWWSSPGRVSELGEQDGGGGAGTRLGAWGACPSDCPTPSVPTAGLTEPVLIRLDVDAKLNEQLKVQLHPRASPGPAPPQAWRANPRGPSPRRPPSSSRGRTLRPPCCSTCCAMWCGPRTRRWCLWPLSTTPSTSVR